MTKNLSRFNNLKSIDEGKYTSLCPAHADTSNSLQININDNGSTHLYCHAGCRTMDILSSVNLTYRDIAPTNPDLSWLINRRLISSISPLLPVFQINDYIYFEYPDKTIHARSTIDKSKQFWQGKTDTCFTYDNINGYVNERVLLVCEGETDCIAAIEAGYRAVGIPGAKTFTKRRMEWLRDRYTGLIDRIIVIGDNDKAGYEFALLAKNHLQLYFQTDIYRWNTDLPVGYDLASYYAEHQTLPNLFAPTQYIEHGATLQDIVQDENRLLTLSKRELSKYRCVKGTHRQLFLYWNGSHYIFPCESEIIPAITRAYPEEKLFINELKNIRDYIKAHCEMVDLSTLNYPIGNFENWLVETDGKRRPTPQDWVFNPVHSYNPELGESDRFLETLDQWYPWAKGSDKQFILELLAYVTLIRHNEYSKFVNFYGEGANGKTKLVELLMEVVGFGHYETVDLSTLNHFTTSSFLHKQLIVAPDAGASLSEQAYSVIKQVATEKYIKFEPKGQTSFTAQNVSKLVIASNHKLIINKREDSHGFWRRLVVLPHTRTFPVNPKFGKWLFDDLPKIINTLVNAAISLEKRGYMLETPEQCQASIDDLKTRVNPLKTFVDQYNWENIDSFVYADMITNYVNWLEDNGSALLGRLLEKAKGANDDERKESVAKSLAKKHGGIAGEFTSYIQIYGFKYGKDRKRFITYSRESAVSETYRPVLDTTYLIRTIDDVHRCIDECIKNKIYCFDTETTLDESLLERQIVGWSVGTGNQAWVFLPHNLRYTFDALAILADRLFNVPDIQVVMQNCKYDLHMLANHGFRVNNIIHDTLIMAYVINPESEKGLKVLAKRYLGRDNQSDYKKLFGKKSLLEINDIEKIYQYMYDDAIMPLELFEHEEFVRARSRSIYEINMQITLNTFDTERFGIGVDAPRLFELLDDLMLNQQTLQRVFTDQGVNPNSNKQLGEFLASKNIRFTHTDKGNPALAGSDIDALIIKYPNDSNIKQLAEYRENEQSKRLLEKLTKHIRKDRLYGEFNVYVTSTGRLSSSRPNLQNIPHHSSLGKSIRRLVIPRAGSMFVVADYSQIELRVLGHFTQDPLLVQAFRENIDLHTMLAAKLYNKPENQIDKEERAMGKKLNFSIVYGVGPKGLSKQTGLDYDTCYHFIQVYKETYKGVMEWIEKVKQTSATNGFVDTLLGHRRYIEPGKTPYEKWRAETIAVNTIIQGSASDIIKQAWINFYKLDDLKLTSKIILQVHDEFVFEVQETETDKALPVIKELMENAIPLSVPIIVDARKAGNWYEGK